MWCDLRIQAGVSDRHPQFYPVVRRMDQILLRTEVRSVVLDRRMPQEQLDLLQLAARHSFAQVLKS